MAAPGGVLCSKYTACLRQTILFVSVVSGSTLFTFGRFPIDVSGDLICLRKFQPGDAFGVSSVLFAFMWFLDQCARTSH